MGVTRCVERYTSGFLAYQRARMLYGDGMHHVYDDDDEQFPAFRYGSDTLSAVSNCYTIIEPFELNLNRLKAPVAKWFPNSNLYDPRDHLDQM
ncbi:phosphotyrosyl phosphate activator [Anopheles sinensis]|uniref:Phosphotyrosyl phosphate activator n=1 Tax=Anopheles sinensis TaxID=74873 RepID=A0A084WTZ1_ANOSI|nr:phosphotyrosyl phosphate activator [Anopheles sinensis]